MLPTEPTPIAILHVFGRMARGGAEMRTLELLRHVDRQRFRFEFCVLTGLAGELDDEIRALGGTIHYLKLGPGFALRFPALLRQRGIRVVHSHVHLFSGLILLLAARAGVPVRLAHFRNTHDGHAATIWRRGQNRLMKYLLLRSATKFLAVSEGAMASVWGEDWSRDPRCEVVYNGFDFARFADPGAAAAVRLEFGVPEQSRLYLHVGRMAAAKNHPRLVAIFRQIARRDPTARLLLAGRGGNAVEERTRQLCRELAVEEQVIFAGERNDIPRLLRAADLLLFPSLWEGLPGAVLEACAAGTPVLASDLPGVREIRRLVPGAVTALPLAADDTLWAETAITLCARRPGAEQSAALFRTIRESEFAIERSLEKLSRVWDAGRPEAYARPS